MDEQLKEKLGLAVAQAQKYYLTAGKKYERARRDAKRFFNAQDHSTWKGKAIYRWSMEEMLHFFKTEVGVENVVLHRLEESEIDGSILDMTIKLRGPAKHPPGHLKAGQVARGGKADEEDTTGGDEALMDTLKVDALTIRKLRRKLKEMEHDYEKEEHEAELVNFFDNIVVDTKGTRLSKYKDVLLENIGVTRVVELPSLIDEPGFFSKLGLSFTEEARLKQQVNYTHTHTHTHTTHTHGGSAPETAGTIYTHIHTTHNTPTPTPTTDPSRGKGRLERGQAPPKTPQVKNKNWASSSQNTWDVFFFYFFTHIHILVYPCFGE
jgi:hypothetical protein